MINAKDSFTKKETAFCYHYIKTNNAPEAARLAGYTKKPMETAIRLLSNSKISRKIEKLYSEKKITLKYKATTGYERLAFGNIADSIKLLFCENISAKDLEKMDLFNIAEIRKPREGAMEIKFFDRLKALEKLEEIDANTKDEGSAFYKALEKGFEKLNSEQFNSEN